MGLTEAKSQSNTYVTVAQGYLRRKVEESTPGAVKREYELKDGTKGEKYEIMYESLVGRINHLGFKETEFGKNLEIGIDDVTVSINTESRYFLDIAKKIPALDLSKEVLIRPYDFEAKDTGKRLVGFTVEQDFEKVTNFFYDGTKNLHGFPEIEDGEKDSDDWKVYFLGVKKFLIKYLEEMPKNFIEPKESVTPPDPEITAEDLPF